MKKYIPFRFGRGMSFLADKRTVLVSVILLAVALVVFVLSIGIGTTLISPVKVVKALVGLGTHGDTVIVHKLRLPRVVVALLVGASLAAAGAILQGIIRNPLASPDIIGITNGASVTAVLFISVFHSTSIRWLPFAAFAGAAAVTFLIYALAWKRGVTPTRLVLMGVGIGTAMHAVTTLMIVTSPFYLTSKALVWLTGSVYGSSWTSIYTLLPWFLVFMPLAFLFARVVNVQQLGDDLASGVGNAVQKYRFILLFICVALAGSAVAFGGAIGFVGLVAPHMARRLVGPSFGGLLPVSALLGGIVVMAADLVARTAFAPLDLPVGLFTALIGAPYFIYLLLRTRQS